MVRKDKIVAILDLETAGNSQLACNLLKNISKKGKLKNIAGESKEKSFIISDSGFYLSPISSTTLLKRSYNSNVDLDTI
mgnify:CR=1 FL=1